MPKATKKLSSSKKQTTKTIEQRPQNAKVEQNKSTKRFPIKRKYLIIPLIAAIIIALLYFGRSLLVAATVNGEPITRWKVISQLEKQNGQQALNNLVIERLLLQEAKRKNITISDEEIQKQMQEIEKNVSSQGQKLDDILKERKLSRKDVEQQIRSQKIAEKLVADQTKVSDEEVNKYLEENKAMLPEGQSEEQNKTQARAVLGEQKFNEKISAYIEKLRAEAKITYFVSY